MPVRRNPAYAGGDPYLAQATQNIASLFAPEDPSKIAAGALAVAKAKTEQDNAARLADLYAKSQGPAPDMQAFDRGGVAAGLFNPSQSYYAVDTKAATDRYGYDTTARTSLATNAADNNTKLRQTGITTQGNTIASLYGALNPGQVRPAVPEEVAGVVGLPAIGQAQGMPKPVSLEEAKGGAFAALPLPAQQGVVTGGVGTQNIIDPITGKLRVESNAGAIGLEPAPDPQKAPKVMTWVHPDTKQRGTAVLGPDGALVDTQTKQPVPAGAVTAELTGGQEDTGIGTSAKNSTESKLLDLSQAEQTLNQFEDLVKKNPAAQGLVGQIRGTVQDVMATGGEVGKLLNVNVNKLRDDITAGRVDPEVAAKFGGFDPAIPAANLYEKILVAQVAKMMDPNGRISNQNYQKVESSLGAGGLLSNGPRTLATLSSLRGIINSQRQMLSQVSPAAAAIRPAAPAATGGPTVGDVVDGYEYIGGPPGTPTSWKKAAQ